MSAPRRCAGYPPNTATSRVSRSPAAKTVSTWWRGSSTRRRGTSRRGACWCAKSATARWPPSGASAASSSHGRSRKYSSIERLPLARQARDERALARGDAAPEARVAAQILQQPRRDREIVELAETILQSLELRRQLEQRVARIAQALKADAQLVARARFAPVDVPRRLARLALQPLERVGGKIRRERAARAQRPFAQDFAESPRGDRSACSLARLQSLGVRREKKVRRRALRDEPCTEHVPVARGAERRRQVAQRPAQRLGLDAERAQQRAQAAQADAQLVEIFRIVRFEHAARVRRDLRE